jgi:carbon-monoxide dehydrogenase medium subunit
MQLLAVHRSRKLIPEFELHRPKCVEDACAILRAHKDAAVIAGGIDLVSRMKAGTGPAHVVAIADIAELHAIRLVADCISIGAAATHREIETDRLIRSRIPAVAEYVSALGNIRIRCQGTIGGNVMADDPGYEMLPLLLVLDAVLNFCDPASGEARTVSARDFAGGGTAVSSFGLLISISVPLAPMLLIWNRDLRPMMALVAGLQWSDGSPVGGGAALVGAHRRAVWRPMTSGDRPDALKLDGAASTLATRWAAALPEPDLVAGARAPESPDLAERASPIYARRVAAVMLRRALVGAGMAA